MEERPEDIDPAISRKRTKIGLISATIIIVALLILSAYYLLKTQSELDDGIIYINHSGITIVGNENFTAENGVTGGNGTPDNPYIIEKWRIIHSGISLEKTSANVIIRNVSLGGNVTNGNSFIYCIFVSNCTIEDSTIIGGGGDTGSLMIFKCDNIAVTGSIFYGREGIEVQDSTNVSIQDNRITSGLSSFYNDDAALSGGNVTNLLIEGNDFTGSGRIRITYSENIVVVNNILARATDPYLNQNVNETVFGNEVAD
jgi:hypothetical protein